jgi:O-antigen chain-terminating methyltransferase
VGTAAEDPPVEDEQGRQEPEKAAAPLSIDDFLGSPTREIGHWRWLWEGDQRFPIRSHRGILGRLLVAAKRLLRPVFRFPVADLWERQRVFNLILLEKLEALEDHEQRIRHLEAFMAEGLQEVLRHDDALFARVDQKLDRYRREARDLASSLDGALALVEQSTAGENGADLQVSAAPLVRAREEQGYLELERRYRGTEEEIGERLAAYLRRLEGCSPVLDLGCGRGESLEVFGAHGLEARGVDGSAEMVARCRERGLAVEEGDLFEFLAAQEPGSFGAVVSFHVIEHLPVTSLDRLVRLAYRVLRPGGRLILETPNPLSVVVAARNFWLDPTHRRPVHPESLGLIFELAGFDPVERLDLRPFAPADRLPEIALADLPEAQHQLADRINRLRDRLDDVLFGYQDYALLGTRPDA